MNLKVIPFTETYYVDNTFFKDSLNGVLMAGDVKQEISYLICSSKDRVVGSILRGNSADILFNTTRIDTISGNIFYKDISDLIVYDNELFVVDSVYNIIVKYDLTGFTTDEKIFRNLPLIKEITGGAGSVEQSNKFKELKRIDVNDSLLVAYDEGDAVLKVYDRGLNWINTKIIKKFFNTFEKFEDIVLLSNNDLICCEEKKLYYFKFIENNYVLDKEISFEQIFNSNPWDEKIKRLYRCSSNSNLIYVLTNKTVKKVWVTQPGNLIGEFISVNSSNANFEFAWLANNSYDSSFDNIILFGRHTQGNTVSNYFNFFKDEFEVDSILSNTNFDIFSAEEIYINREEYVQSWVYVKSFKKIMYNCLKLAKNINYKFLESSTLPYNKIVDKTYNNSIINFSNDFNFDVNLNIGINEIFQAEVFNRLIKTVLNFQNLLLKVIIKNENKRKYYSPNPFKKDSTIKQYYYFVDESLSLDPNPVVMQSFEELAPGPGILTSLGGAPYTSFDDITISEGVVA